MRASKSTLILLAVLAVLAYVATCQSRRAGELEARLQFAEHLSRDATERADSVARAAQAERADLQSKIERLTQRLATAEERATRAMQRARERADSTLAAMPESTDRAALDSVIAGYEAALAAQDSVIATQRETIALLARDTSLARIERAVLSEALERAQHELGLLRRRARGARVELVYGPGFGIVAAGSALHAGPGIFVGLKISL